MKQIITRLLALILLASVVACKKNNSPSDRKLGEATITVTGEVEGTYSGMADFHYIDHTSGASWEIFLHDSSPAMFSLTIMQFGVDEDVTRPGTGTYSIGGAVLADYAGVFSFYDGNPMSSIEYGTEIKDGDAGSLTITSSDENTVKGTFQFTADRHDDEMNVVGTINASGEFTANKRQFD